MKTQEIIFSIFSSEQTFSPFHKFHNTLRGPAQDLGIPVAPKSGSFVCIRARRGEARKCFVPIEAAEYLRFCGRYGRTIN